MSKTRPRNYVTFKNSPVDQLTPKAWLRYQALSSSGDDEAQAALKYHRIDAANRNLEIELPRNVRNALSTGQGTAGGWLVSEGFIGGWLRAQAGVGAIRANATPIPVGHGGIWQQPWVDGRDVEGEVLVEGTPGEPDDVEFARGSFKLHRFASRATRVPNSLIEDAPDFDNQLGYVLGDQVALRQNRAFTLGSGVNEPQGIVTGAVQVPAASATAIATSDFKLLIQAVGEAHAAPGTAKIMMHPHVFAAILVAPTGDGARIHDFPNGKLFGLYDVLLNPHMDNSTAAGKRTVVFGNFSRYGIAEAPAVQLQAAKEAYVEFNQTVFRAVHPADARIMQPADKPFAVLCHN